MKNNSWHSRDPFFMKSKSWTCPQNFAFLNAIQCCNCTVIAVIFLQLNAIHILLIIPITHYLQIIIILVICMHHRILTVSSRNRWFGTAIIVCSPGRSVVLSVDREEPQFRTDHDSINWILCGVDYGFYCSFRTKSRILHNDAAPAAAAVQGNPIIIYVQSRQRDSIMLYYQFFYYAMSKWKTLI